MKTLETKSLAIGYSTGRSTKTLQKELNVTLHSGEVIALMGQNGVGKTTFIKSISKLIPVLDGDAIIGGKSLFSLTSQEVSQKVSLVLTDKPQVGNMSVIELVAIGRHPYSGALGFLKEKDKQVIEWAINKTNINYIANHKIGELSDGQLQKVLIARALTQETDLIILDEPVAHLDLNNKIEVMLLLKEIAQSGKSILISTHDLQISLQIADRLWLFNFNEPMVNGVPEDLIINGAISKTLSLDHHDYDLRHGRLSLQITGIPIKVQGEETITFWMEQALRRSGFAVDTNANILVQCHNNHHFSIAGKDYESIQEVLQALDTLASHHLSTL
ncbi:MAG: ABC transporter ATP-binding protein [Cyclobacteriaceae bacterium]|nr:ABC transporter ATP-binding protein [Cyclobacteriaceae bacterium HetDA_MAG_MS6]